VCRLYKLNLLYDGFNLLLSDMAVCYNHCVKDNIKTFVILVLNILQAR